MKTNKLNSSNSFTHFAFLDSITKLCTSHMSLKGLSYPTLFVQINDVRSSSFSIFEKTLRGMAPTPHYGIQEVVIIGGNPNVRIEVVWLAPPAEPPLKMMPLNHNFHPSSVNGLPLIPCLLNLGVTKNQCIHGTLILNLRALKSSGWAFGII